MNGRVYDYNLARFTSVDPFIQSPLNSQSINPYSYIMNNPLAGVDPSGYTSVDAETENKIVGATIQSEATKVTETGSNIARSGTKYTVTVQYEDGTVEVQESVTVDSSGANTVLSTAKFEGVDTNEPSGSRNDNTQVPQNAQKTQQSGDEVDVNKRFGGTFFDGKETSVTTSATIPEVIDTYELEFIRAVGYKLTGDFGPGLPSLNKRGGGDLIGPGANLEIDWHDWDIIFEQIQYVHEITTTYSWTRYHEAYSPVLDRVITFETQHTRPEVTRTVLDTRWEYRQQHNGPIKPMTWSTPTVFGN